MANVKTKLFDLVKAQLKKSDGDKAIDTLTEMVDHQKWILPNLSEYMFFIPSDENPTPWPGFKTSHLPKPPFSWLSPAEFPS